MTTLFINGSPKSKGSTSALLTGLLSLCVRGEVIKEQVGLKGDHHRILHQIKGGNTVVFVLPLYLDGIPAHVLAFMKEMESYCQEELLELKIYVVSNGGFIEGRQSQPLMDVFENFCARCHFKWCGGVGIGGGVMINVLRTLLLAFVGLFVVQCALWGVSAALPILLQQLTVLLLLSLGVLCYGLRLAFAINKGKCCGVGYTRVLLPSFAFILFADLYFLVISIWKGGFFKGWLRGK